MLSNRPGHPSNARLPRCSLWASAACWGASRERGAQQAARCALNQQQVDEKAKHGEHTRKVWTSQSWKKRLLANPRNFEKCPAPPKNEKCEKHPPNAVFRPWECFFRIPHAFLILLAGFSSNFAKSAPISGRVSVFGCPCDFSFMLQKLHFFVHLRKFD